jgi:diacylglycerol kinase (ATP)
VSKDFVIIANPVSGSQRAIRLAGQVKELLTASNARVQLELTTNKGAAFEIAREAALSGAKSVAGCGGDGTLQEIATALENSDTALGILPCGRCNDFGRALGLFRSDTPEKMAYHLLHGRLREVDLGAISSKRFLTVATLGFDSEVSRFVETRRLWVRGTGAYLYAVMRLLFRFRPPTVKLAGDFGRFEGRILLSATGNSPNYGGAMQIAPGAQIDDGLFRLCVVENVPRLTVLAMLPRVLKGTHIHHPAVRMFDTSYLEIDTPEGPEWICADGESLAQSPARFEVRPKAIKVLAPDLP